MCMKISSQKFGERLVITLDGVDEKIREKIGKMLSDLITTGDVSYEDIPENKMIIPPKITTEDLSKYLVDTEMIENRVRQTFMHNGWLGGFNAVIHGYQGTQNEQEKKIIKDTVTDHAIYFCNMISRDPNRWTQPVYTFLTQMSITAQPEVGSLRNGIMQMMSTYFN